MAVPIMEQPTGDIDGINRVFVASHWYVSGSVRAFTPTLQDEVFVTELGAGQVQLEEAPMPGDLVYLFYAGL